MKSRAVLSKINGVCFRAPLASLMVLVLAGLVFLSNQLNFDIPAASKVRDAASFVKTFEEAEALDMRTVSAEIATSYVSAVPVTYRYSGYGAGASAPVRRFSISEPTKVSDPSVDAGYGVMRYTGFGGRFLYGHSSLAFAPLKRLFVGDTFTATIDGETATYQVVARYVFNKASELDGGANNARRIRIYSARDESGGLHSLSLMTCGNGGNDDPGWRLVLYADRV